MVACCDIVNGDEGGIEQLRHAIGIRWAKRWVREPTMQSKPIRGTQSRGNQGHLLEGLGLFNSLLNLR